MPFSASIAGAVRFLPGLEGEGSGFIELLENFADPDQGSICTTWTPRTPTLQQEGS